MIDVRVVRVGPALVSEVQVTVVRVGPAGIYDVQPIVVTGVITTGPPGPPGSSSSTFEFIQTVPQSVWVVEHDFGRYPVAWSLYDSDGRLCDNFSVQHMSLNICRISMDIPTAGLIRLI